MKVVNKKWGYEIILENNTKYCGKHLHVIPGKQCSVHYHKNKKETFYVISGELILEYSNSLDKQDWISYYMWTKHLRKGDSFTIEPLVAHRFRSATNSSCDFIEISTHHDDNDSYRIIESI